VLDVILSDDPLIVNSVSAAQPLGHSDHLTVEFSIAQVKATTPTESSQQTTPKYSWLDGNFDAMRSTLNRLIGADSCATIPLSNHCGLLSLMSCGLLLLCLSQCIVIVGTQIAISANDSQLFYGAS